MPSAFVLAKDNLQQARSILSNEIWFDREVDFLIDLAIARLWQLESDNIGLPRPTDWRERESARTRIDRICK